MRKKYLLDIPHPHFVHFFRNIVNKLGKENVVITSQRVGIITRLLELFGYDYIIIGNKYNGKATKALGQVWYLLKYLELIKRYNINNLLGMSPSMAIAAKISRRKMFYFDDDDSAVQPISKRVTIPLSDYVITPKCLEYENYGLKHIVYSGYQELAYLAPEYFQPKIEIVHNYGLEPGSYFVIRWNAFKAHHDAGETGIPKWAKQSLVKLLESTGKVLITSEYKLENEYERYRMSINPIDIHHILAFARLFIGDSQTMTAEAAVLGTPAIRCNTFKGRIAYLKELEERYGLTYAFLPVEIDAMMAKLSSLLEQNDLKEIWRGRREVMLAQMEDVNQFIFEFLDREALDK